MVPVEIEFVKENHRWFLRVFIYSYEKDVTLDDCYNFQCVPIALGGIYYEEKVY